MVCINNFLTKTALTFWLSFALGSTVFASGVGGACHELFLNTEQATNSKTTERRKGNSFLLWTPSKKTDPQFLDTVMLPDQTRVIMSYEKHLYYEDRLPYENNQMRLYQETVVYVDGVARVFREEIPMDHKVRFVVNANLDKGRKLYDRSLEKGQGVVVFIDVNDLGWINKFFKNGIIDGDDFVAAVSKAIQDISNKRGLVFRLGGDEFGILMPMMKPEQIKQILEIVQAKTKEYAEKIFRQEQERRWQAYQDAKVARDDAKTNPDKYTETQMEDYQAQLEAARDSMYTYLHYSQPSIAIGATYYGGRPADVIQKEVERNALPHKVAIKRSNHASEETMAKYLSDPNEIHYAKGPLFKVEYEFPLLPDRTHSPPPRRALTDFNKPQIKWTRIGDVLYHIGHYNISNFRSDHGIVELKVETYRNSKLIDITDLPIHKHTKLINGQSRISQDLMTELSASTTYQGLWVNLLNLGLMNYFEHKSETGDKALARVAQIMTIFFNSEAALVGKKHIGFKIQGSEFQFFIEGVDPHDLIATLTMLFNSDPLLKQIYEDQLNYLVLKNASGEDNSQKIEQLRHLMNGPLVQIQQR